MRVLVRLASTAAWIGALTSAVTWAIPAAPARAKVAPLGAHGAPPVILRVDLTEAARRIVHARLQIPVSPGPLTLYYPKWVPGEHGPTGPVGNLAGLRFAGNGKSLPWRRDDVDMYAIHVVIPSGVRSLDVSLDFLLSSDEHGFIFAASSTANLAVLSWNQVLLYPAGTSPDRLTYAASLRLPEGWRYGTALPVAREAGATVDFKPVSLVTLIDSPVNAGRYFRTIPLAPDVKPRHVIDLAADSKEALEMRPEEKDHYSRLVREAGALFRARHYREYHFLYTLSDHVPFFGLEHHESSDNRGAERALIDEDSRVRQADLLPHEFAHSWNGKYRRPADLTTPDYQQPMKTDLLWVYEGLTEYLGWLLAARSGLLTPDQARDYLATVAATLDNEPGRTWRPLLDTAVSAQVLYGVEPAWASWRRDVDFYDESMLFWLEADAIIREESKGARSLDDFCRRFHGGESGAPEVRTYTFEEVVSALSEVQPYDWRSFFTQRVMEVRPRPPLGGIEREGWRLSYADTVPAYQKSLERARKRTDLRYSLGLYLMDDGTIRDVLPQSPAAKGGLAPSMKLVAVNGRQFTAEATRAAVRAAARSKVPIEVLAQNGDFYATYRIDYHGGERYPRLVRGGKPDLLSENLTPHAGAEASPGPKGR